MDINNVTRGLSPIIWKDVDITGGLLGTKQQINHSVTIPIEYKRLQETGRLESLKMKWKPGDPNRPHHFWDSDIAKWIEASAYSLAKQPDSQLEKNVDDAIDLIEAGQHTDGYFNTYFTVVDPGKRWTNLYYMHELYCAGHLIEAAVAYYYATGKRKMLDVMCRYSDHIAARFGTELGKIRGYCGHPEIELALVKLYRATGEEKYLKLSKYFVDERGSKPYYFELESLQRGVNVEMTADRQRHLKYYLKAYGPFAEYQAHRPLREQDAPAGHAVRAMYIYCAMADLAAETEDKTLLDACERIWNRLTERQVTITGGIGSSPSGERFTFDYDLPNEYTYNETCASIGLIMWAHRLLQFESDSRYSDMMEQVLYNTVLSSVSLNGDRFFYANYLSVYPDRFKYAGAEIVDKMYPERQEWFNVACCPPNLARLIASIGQYMYSTSSDGVYVHLYNDSKTTAVVKGTNVDIKQCTEYPWNGNIKIEISPEDVKEFKVALRRPGWCQNSELRVNGVKTDVGIFKGYYIIEREWKKGDVVELILDMPVLRVESHPSVRANAGKIALQRGPLIYCLEEIDNSKDLNDIRLIEDAEITVSHNHDVFGEIVTLETKGIKRDLSGWDEKLYRPVKSEKREISVKAIPYFLWANRGPGEMTVWVKTE